MTFRSMARMASSNEEDKVVFVKGAGGVRDEQNTRRPQKGRQGPMHQLGGDEDVHDQEHEAGDPKGRGDLAFQGEVGLDLEERLPALSWPASITWTGSYSWVCQLGLTARIFTGASGRVPWGSR